MAEADVTSFKGDPHDSRRDGAGANMQSVPARWLSNNNIRRKIDRRRGNTTGTQMNVDAEKHLMSVDYDGPIQLVWQHYQQTIRTRTIRGLDITGPSRDPSTRRAEA
ncbi:hypothetical protein F5Y12DRAFT_715253 [Xylaria sp. FL1777]|nr:hypothetical protein F5Y12DRAFT_715253 [Xylaria sp. FL1777]